MLGKTLIHMYINNEKFREYENYFQCLPDINNFILLYNIYLIKKESVN